MATLNLQTKIVLYTVGVIVTMVVAFTAMNLWMDVASTRDHLRTHVADLARGIAPTVRSDLQYRRIHELRSTVQNFSYNNAVRAIDILDPELELVTGTGTGTREDYPQPPEDVVQTRGIPVWDWEGQMVALAPVKGERGDKLGSVRVLATAEEELLSLRRKLSRSLIFAGLFGIMGCIIGYYAGKHLTRPLEYLTKASEDLANGRDPDLVEVRSRDELGGLSTAFNRMVEKRREAETSLEQSRQHLLFILRETPIGYIEWSLDFRVLGWNKAAERIFGYSEEEALGKTGFDLIVKPDLRDQVSEIWGRIINGEGGNENLNENVRADGSFVDCQWNYTLIRGSNGEVIAVASLVNDVTDNMRTQETMRMAMVEAQKATQTKSEFLANMSHEIRTPMNGVIGLTELLLESDLDPQQRSYLEVIRSSGEMLITIINDILDLAKIESGKLQLTEKVFDVDQCLGSAFDLFRHSLDSKGLASRVELDDSLPKTVNGDAIRLRQVIYNLVSNAVKFTEDGSICLRAWAEEITSMRIRLFVSVEDSGPGIHPDQLESIFEPFSQADTSATRSHGGTGLGLTICKRICTLMRGDIRVEKSGPEGTRFTFHVELNSAPMDKDPPSKPRVTAQSSPHTANSDLKILIVEDNSVNRLVTKRILKRLGYESAAVTNGQEAVEFYKESPCDLIFMDLQMPVMDGLTATRLIRGLNEHKPVIVALTASAVEGDRERCLQAGMNDYISKPINIDSVKAVITRVTANS